MKKDNFNTAKIVRDFAQRVRAMNLRTQREKREQQERKLQQVPTQR